LCGAWGFTLCLHYRAFAWRLEEFLAGNADDVITGTMVVLGSTMAISDSPSRRWRSPLAG
ncbi:MAG: hypothetical protein P8K76_00795, partial [Candidatus Binatia bacterium]|nr:hypothetical protein [Candidatus Binatia bacterium]